MPSVSRAGSLAVAILVSGLLASAGPASGQGAAARPDVDGVHIDARLIRDTFVFRNQPMPAWIVELTIRNDASAPIEMGRDLIVITPNSATQNFLGVHVSRLSAGFTDSDRVNDRYGLDWGIDVAARGSTLWPFLAFQGVDRLAALLMMAASTPEKPLPGGGYGAPIAPGEARTIRQRVLFPFDVEFKNQREVVLVLPPRLRTAGRFLPSRLLTFDVRGPAVKDQAFADARVDMAEGADALSSTIANSERPLWRRVVAVNWLAEHHPNQAAPALMTIAQNAAQPLLLRRSAVLNAGYWRLPGVVDGVTKLALAEADLRRAALWALGRLGDPSAAASIRPFVSDKDDGTARFAIEALGALKDVESVPLFAAALSNTKRIGLYPVAAAALVVAQTDAARALVVQQSQDRKRRDDQREALIAALGNAAATWAVAPLVAIAGNEQDKEDLRVQAVRALTQYGRDASAVAAIRQAATGSKKKLKEAATRALAELEDETQGQ